MKEKLKEELKKKVKIIIPFSEVEKKMEENFLELSKNLKIPGFRPGKIPISFVKNKYEKDNINFLGKIKHGELPKKLQEYDVHFNCAKDGFFDKSILETLSCEIINFYKNKDFNSIFGNDSFNFKNSENLIMKLNQLSKNDNEDIFNSLKNIKSQLQKNSLETLNKRLADYL